MTTVSKLRNKMANKFSSHLVSIDQNVIDEYDQETAFHAVVHPQMNAENKPQLPNDVEEFIENNCNTYKTKWCGLHIHVHASADIDETEQLFEKQAEEVEI